MSLENTVVSGYANSEFSLVGFMDILVVFQWNLSKFEVYFSQIHFWLCFLRYFQFFRIFSYVNIIQYSAEITQIPKRRSIGFTYIFYVI